MSKKRILVTGFEPFGGEAINPSQLLLESLQQESSFLEDIEFKLLPVSFESAAQTILSLLKQHSYDVVLQLGQAGGRKTICLERVALNWMDAHKDEAGYRPEGGSISDLAPAAYLSHLPLNEIRDRLKEKGHEVTISLSAGAFVCNYIYFKSREYVENVGLGTQVLFVHVPYLPLQVIGKNPETPSMEFETMFAGIRDLLFELKSLK